MNLIHSNLIHSNLIHSNMIHSRWLPLLGLLAFVVQLDAQTLRCGSRLVTRDDYDFQVRERCGDPFWIENRYEVTIAGHDSAFETRTGNVYTAWYYNFGPTRLMVRLLFRDGRMVGEQTLGYGLNDPGSECGPAKMTRGLSSGELIAYCGEPLSRHDIPVEVIQRDSNAFERRVEVSQQEWIYDLGGDFLYALSLINGRVDSVRSIHR